VRKGRSIADLARDSFRRATRAGVLHACGTDAGTPFNPHGSAPVEIIRMVEWGLTPLKAMQAATSNAAGLLRRPDVGVIEVGARADLVVFAGDPLEDIRQLLDPQLVMKDGEYVTRGR
jgi:imidazolonepropionase-like amidohydrolase